MTDLIPFGSSVPQTMSSREIAELTGKQHKHVIRDIRTLLEQIYDGPDLDHIESKGIFAEKDARGYVAVYHLDRDHTYTLIAGYKADLRFRIIKRWQELESKQSAPSLAPSIPDALLAQAHAIVEQHRRLDAHDAQFAAQGQKLAVLENHITTLVAALREKRRRRSLSIDPRQTALDLSTRRKAHQGGTHASPTQHTRREHYRRLSDGRQVKVRAAVIGRANRHGETIQ